MLTYSDIIEKAKSLGIDPTVDNAGNKLVDADDYDYECVSNIASQLGLDPNFFNIHDIDNKLNEMVLEKENSNNSEDGTQEKDATSSTALENGYEGPAYEGERPRFGEQEYNKARDKYGAYDKDFYDKKGEELDKKVEDAKQEKATKTKEEADLDENGNAKWKEGEEPKHRIWENGKETTEGAPTKTVNKTRREQLKDDINLKKAQLERANNKIDHAKANMYRASHPLEALKNDAKAGVQKKANQVKDKAKEAAKDTAKKAGKAAGNAAKKAGKKILQFIAANPWVLAVIGGLLLVLIILLLVTGGDSSDSDNNKYGLNGYSYLAMDNFCDEIYVYNTSSGDDGTYQLEDYVAGVVAAEVGGFGDETLYEVFSIAARTYALNRLKNSDSCQIQGNATAQAFRKTTNEEIINAVNNTRGLVLTRDGSIFSTMYDAFCWDSKDDDYYYMCQRNYDLGEIFKIPTSWVEEYVPRLSGDYILAAPRTASHGQGMSQDGAYYLATELGMSRDEIITFFYGSNATLMSVYQAFSYDGEFGIDPNGEEYQNLTFVTKSIESVLAEYGMTLDDYNDYLLNVVTSSGVGTRAAVVNVAVSLIGSLADMGYKLPYQWGGKYYAIGANPNWGTDANMSWLCDNYANQGFDKSVCLTNYKWHSFDCSGFVNWALINGFQYKNYNEELAAGAYQSTDTTNAIALDANKAVCQPGDVIVNSGHITLVVGTDDTKKQYIVAESTGSRLATGVGGVKLSYYSYGNSKYMCRSLSNLYLNASGSNDYDQSGSSDSNVTPNSLYFVGDSRTVGMCTTVGICASYQSCNTDACLAEVGKGYSWFNSNISTVLSTKRSRIIINMGVNDLTGNASGANTAQQYFNLYRTIASENRNKVFYIMSVNPVGEGTSVNSTTIIAFNNKMRELISSSGLSNLRYMDAYNNVNFTTTDGLHYDAVTYGNLYNYVLGVVK